MDPHTQETKGAGDTDSNGAADTSPTVVALQAELAALKAKAAAKAVKPAAVSEDKVMTVAEAVAFMATFEGKKGRRPASFYEAKKIAGEAGEAGEADGKAKKPKLVVAQAPKAAKAAKAVKAVKVPKAPKGVEKADCSFPECVHKVIAKGLCPSHYRQKSRGIKLKPLREVGRGLVRLPMVIRVEEETLKLLKKRIKSGLANSMYDATRQALEAGIAGWPKE
jgi:hypothetical protein